MTWVKSWKAATLVFVLSVVMPWDRAAAAPGCDSQKVGTPCTCVNGSSGTYVCAPQGSGGQVGEKLVCDCAEGDGPCTEGETRPCSGSCGGYELCRDKAWVGCYEDCDATCGDRTVLGRARYSASCGLGQCQALPEHCACPYDGHVSTCVTGDSRGCEGQGICYKGRVICGKTCNGDCGSGAVEFDSECNAAQGAECFSVPTSTCTPTCPAQQECSEYIGFVASTGDPVTCRGELACAEDGTTRGCKKPCTTRCGNPGWREWGADCDDEAGECNPHDWNLETCPLATCVAGSWRSCTYTPHGASTACSQQGTQFCSSGSWTQCLLPCQLDCGIWGDRNGYARGALPNDGGTLCDVIDVCIAPTAMSFDTDRFCRSCYEGSVEACTIQTSTEDGSRECGVRGRRICQAGRWSPCQSPCNLTADIRGIRDVEFLADGGCQARSGSVCSSVEICGNTIDEDGIEGPESGAFCGFNPGLLSDGSLRYGPNRWPDAGWTAFDAGSVWHRPLPNPVPWHPDGKAFADRVFRTDAGVTNGTGWAWAKWDTRQHEGGAFGEPTYFAQPTDPIFHIKCDTSWGCKERDNPSIDYTDAGVRIPTYVQLENSNDRHLTIVDQDTGVEWDFWHVKRLEMPPGGPNRIYVDSAGKNTLHGSGLRKGTTASHFANIAGRIRIEEMFAEEINHAIYLTTYCTSMGGWEQDAGYTFPARANDLFCDAVRPTGETNRPNGPQPWPSGPTLAHPYDIPMGAMFALDMTASQIDALGLPRWKKTVLKAMAKYGLYVGDTGTNENAIELESGMQYLACGYNDRWVEFAKREIADAGHSSANWVTWQVDEPQELAGKELERFVGDLNVDSHLWIENLRLVDPCWAAQTCP